MKPIPKSGRSGRLEREKKHVRQAACCDVSIRHRPVASRAPPSLEMKKERYQLSLPKLHLDYRVRQFVPSRTPGSAVSAVPGAERRKENGLN